MFRDNSKITSQSYLIWASLAFQAGLINAGAFLACHRFVTHTTGFATHFATDLAMFKFHEATSMILVHLFFLFGCMISAHYVDREIHYNRFPKYHIVFFLMSFFLLVVLVFGLIGLFGEFGSELSIESEFVLIALLGICSGLQNAAISTASHSQIRTTHLTGITTDLGIGLYKNLFLKNKKESPKNSTRLIIIGSFILGSAIGAFLFVHYQYFAFTVPLLLTLCLYFLTRKDWLKYDRTTK